MVMAAGAPDAVILARHGGLAAGVCGAVVTGTVGIAGTPGAAAEPGSGALCPLPAGTTVVKIASQVLVATANRFCFMGGSRELLLYTASRKGGAKSTG